MIDKEQERRDKYYRLWNEEQAGLHRRALDEVNDKPHGNDQPKPVTEDGRELSKVEQNDDGDDTERSQQKRIHSEKRKVK